MSDSNSKLKPHFAVFGGACTGAVLAAMALGVLAIVASARADNSVGGSKVVATVGSHPITDAELEAKLKPEIAAMRAEYEKRVEQAIAERTEDLKKQTLQSMADDYLVQQAAKKDNLSVSDYLKKEYGGKNGVTEAQAQAFYDQHKQQGTPPFAQIKSELMNDMNREALMQRLRKEEPVKILLEPKRVAVQSSGHPELGPADAPVTIVEFTDFQCPFCKRSEDTVKQLRTHYGDKVRLVHMDFPLSFHSHAMDAAKAARCANEQGKFWQYRDALFADQSKLSPADLRATAKQLGLNTTQFNSCFDKDKYQAAIQSDLAQGNKLGVDGTPAFFIDGRSLVGAQPLNAFTEVVDDELSKNTKQASAH